MWEYTYLRVKHVTASQSTPAYRLMYLQTKSKEQIRPLFSHIKKMKIAFVKMARIFYVETDIL